MRAPLNLGGDRLSTAKLEAADEVAPGVTLGYCFHRGWQLKDDFMECPNCGTFWMPGCRPGPLPIVQQAA